jgi:predicted Co/Zn/Cd cation transporter (cation efflux family)
MEKLFLHAGVFALVTLAVAAVCYWFVRQEEKKSDR